MKVVYMIYGSKYNMEVKCATVELEFRFSKNMSYLGGEKLHVKQ